MPSTADTTVPGDPVITVEGVSKKFHIRGKTAGDLRERLAPLFKRRRADEDAPTDFWALKDVSFAVRPGEPLGIVGHNGSGKSTMLKMLTGILRPTRGAVRVRGRIGALIEVGAGFHPDLTGRENIYLNGSILGLSRREIAKKFDSIVDFANLETFIDTPVKRYSSGMYMRLGFSIAAQTEPDVLLIDEVLAVGDSLFQRKCLRRLKEFVADGGALVFVSHAMGQVAELCETCVWLDHGEMRFAGPTSEAIDRYMEVVTERENAELMRTHPDEWAAMETERIAAEDAERRLAEESAFLEEAERREREEAERIEQQRLAGQRALQLADMSRGRLLGVTMRDSRGIARTRFQAGESARIEIAYRFGRPLPDPIVGVDFVRADGLHMFTTSNYDHLIPFRHLPPTGTISLEVGALNMNEGKYRINVNLFAHSEGPDWWRNPEDEIIEAVQFEVTAGRFANGCVFMPTRWDIDAPGPAAETNSETQSAPARTAAAGRR